MNDEIHTVITRIDEILVNQKGEPLNSVGSFIVGATIIRDDYEELREKYPQLGTLAELGADLETTESDDSMSAEIMQQITASLQILKTYVENTPNE